MNVPDERGLKLSVAPIRRLSESGVRRDERPRREGIETFAILRLRDRTGVKAR